MWKETFDVGGNSFSDEGTLTGATISGNYSITNSHGFDSGGFTGNNVPPLAGTFSGSLNLPNGLYIATLTLTEDANYGLKADLGTANSLPVFIMTLVEKPILLLQLSAS